MPESTLGLLFEIGADPSKAENALKQFGYSIDKYIGAAQGTAARTGAAFVAAGKDLLYLGGAAAGLITTAVLLAKRWSDAGTAIYEAHEKTGLAAEKLSGLRVAAMRNRESFETFIVTLARMERSLSVGLANPASDAGKVLHSLFKTTKDFNDFAALPMAERLQQVTQRIDALSDVGDKNAAKTAIMGRGWMAVNSTLGDLAGKTFPQLVAEAKGLNQCWDDKAAAAARQFGFELDEMKIRVEGLALGIGEKLIPSMSRLMFLAEVKLQQSFGKTLLQALRDAGVGLLWMNAQVLALPAGSERAERAISDAAVAMAGAGKETQGMTDALIAQQVEIEKLIRAQKAARESHKAVAQAKKEEKTETAEILRLASELGLATATTDAEYREYLKTLTAINRIHDEQARQALAQMNDERFRQELAKRGNELTKEEIKLSQDMQRNLHLEKDSEDQLTEAEKRAEVHARNLLQRSRELRQEWILQRTQLRLLSSDLYGLYVPAFQAAGATMENFRVVAMNTLAQFQAGLAMNIAQAIVYEKSIGAAFLGALKAAVATLAAEAILQALKCTALGFYFLAIQSYGQAALAFKSAAVWGALGVGAAVVGRAIPSGEKAGGGGGGGAAAGIYGGGGAAAGTAATAGAGPTTYIRLEGISPKDLYTGEMVNALIDQINNAAKNKGKIVISSYSLQPSPVRI